MPTSSVDKGIAGAPSLVHTPGEGNLKVGGKRRSKRGRAALFNKDDAASANSVHVDGALGGPKRKLKLATDFDPQVLASINKDWTKFDEERAANAPGRKAAAPKPESLGIAAGRAGLAAAGNVAGALGGAALGGFGGPIGAAAGGVAGGLAGDVVGRKIADAIYGPQKEANIGTALGSSAVSTAGFFAAEHALPGGAGALAVAVARVLGTAAGDVVGTRFGGYVSHRVGGVLSATTGDLVARYGSEVGFGAAEGAHVARGFRKAAPPVVPARTIRAERSPSPLPPPDSGIGAINSSAVAAQTRFRTLLSARENAQRTIAAKTTLGQIRPENFQASRGDTLAAQRQKLQASLPSQSDPGPYPWSGAKRLTLFPRGTT